MFKVKNKYGEEVNVSQEKMDTLISMGKRKLEDFTPVEAVQGEIMIEETPIDEARGFQAQNYPTQEQQEFRQLPLWKRTGLGIRQLPEGILGFAETLPSIPLSPGHIPIKRTPEEREKIKFRQRVEEARDRQFMEGDLAAGLGRYSADFALSAIPATKGMKLAQMARKTPGFIRGALGGAGAGAGSSAFHQMQRVGTGQEVDPFGAVVETGVGALTGGVGAKTGPYLKKKATDIIQTSMKLSRKIKGQKSMTADQAERFFKNYGSWRGLMGAEKKLTQMEQVLGNEFDNVMSNIAKGKRINVKDAISEARKRFEREVKTGRVNMDVAENIRKKISQFEDYVTPLTDKDGLVNIKLAQRFKQYTLDKMAKYDKVAPMGNYDPALDAAAQGARTVRGKILKKMVKEAPELKDVNKKYSQMAEIRPFIEQSLERKLANRPFSLQDMATLGAGTLGAGGAAYMDKPEYGALALLPFLLSRGQKSPAVAQMLYRLGQGASSRPARDIGLGLMQGARTGLEQYRLGGL